MLLRWPPGFPEDCPPQEAYPANGVYYRIVKNDPPEPGDFASLYRQNRQLADDRIQSGRATQCQTMGLSVFADGNEAVRRAIRFHLIGNKIARLTLGPAAGKILPTPTNGDSHHTWWQAVAYDPTDGATVVINL